MRTCLLSSLILCFTLASCGTNDVVTGGEGTPKEEVAVKAARLISGSRVHLMPKINPLALQNNAAPAGAKLKYFGGKIIPNVKVYQVNWGSGVDPAIVSGMPDFYNTISSSNLWDWMGQEYSTVGLNGSDGLPGSNQILGRGSFGSTINLVPSVTSATISDDQIKAELSNQIGSGVLPAPDDNAIFMVNFPPGKTITQGGSASSCTQFCAYHGTFVRNGQNVYYSVLPSLTGACATGCGNAPTQFQNYTSVASHELAEATTDGEVGLGSTVSRPLAWYDPNNGENGDICNAQQGTITSAAGKVYTVQAEFSNAANNCVVTRVLPGNNFGIAAAPGSASVSAGSSVSYSITTTVTGAAQSVSLSVAGLPAGVTGSFSPAIVNAGSSSTLTLTAAASAGSVTKSFTITGTNSAASHTASASVTVVAATTGGGDTVIANGQTIAGQTASLNAETFYRVDVPAGVALTVTLAGANGDADLAVKSVSKPTTTVFDCKSDGSASDETCTIASTVAGSYFIRVKAFAAYTGLSVSASWSGATGGGDPTLVRGVAVTALAGATGNQKFWQIDVPAGTASLRVAITGGTGDADLYVNSGARPSKNTYTCRPFLNGNSESCTIANPAPGKMFVLIDGFAAYSGVTLTAN
jgi:hypothetical protein